MQDLRGLPRNNTPAISLLILCLPPASYLLKNFRLLGLPQVPRSKYNQRNKKMSKKKKKENIQRRQNNNNLAIKQSQRPLDLLQGL